MEAVTLEAKAVGAVGIWKFRSGEGQDIHVDVRKVLWRFGSFLRAKMGADLMVDPLHLLPIR